MFNNFSKINDGIIDGIMTPITEDVNHDKPNLQLLRATTVASGNLTWPGNQSCHNPTRALSGCASYRISG